MIQAVVISAILLAGQKPETTGSITGIVVPSPQQEISYPVQVILLSQQYTDLWHVEVQKWLDLYWERLQPTFRTQKEYFLEFSKQAHKDATNYILYRMRRDMAANASDFLQEFWPGRKFEFKNLPFGEYKILVIGKSGSQDAVWQKFVEVRSSTPQFIEVKQAIP